MIFCQPNGAYYSPDRVGARVKELMKAVGLEGVSLHNLRHTNATESLRNGVPLAEVSRRLGHADQNITLSIYSHAMPVDESSKKPEPPETTAHYCTEGPQKLVLVENKEVRWRGPTGLEPA